MAEHQECVLVEETGKGLYQVRVETGDTGFFADEPVAVGGLSSGPDPFALVGAALAACKVMTMRLYARRKGWEVPEMGACVLHVKDGGGARDRFDCTLRLDPGLDSEQRSRLLEIAGRCPVHRMLEAGADIDTKVATKLAEPRSEALHGRTIEELSAVD
jgi:putative redox protein